MPYYRCWSCLVISYSAAGYSTVGRCPECATPLGGRSNGLHTGEPALRCTLPARLGSPAEARRAVRALGFPEEDCEKVALLVSELVTNSVRRSGDSAHDPAGPDDSIDLLLTHADDEVHIAVRDRGPGFVPSELPEEPTEGGLGFVVVNALAKGWGVLANGHGSTVWCTMDMPAMEMRVAS